MARTFIVPGEYDMVARASRDVDALRRAHATPITREAAERMARDLARRHLPADVALTFRVLFTSRRGRGGLRYERTRVPRTDWTGAPLLTARGRVRYRLRRTANTYPFVSLPSVPMEPGGTWAGRLRVGIVLHEFVHAWDSVTRGRSDHGPIFVQRLDDLVAEWLAAEIASAPAGAHEE